jgi:hypothetical protein
MRSVGTILKIMAGLRGTLKRGALFASHGASPAYFNRGR